MVIQAERYYWVSSGDGEYRSSLQESQCLSSDERTLFQIWWKVDSFQIGLQDQDLQETISNTRKKRRQSSSSFQEGEKKVKSGTPILSNRELTNDYCSPIKQCPTLCDPMGCRLPGSPVLHYLPEVAWIHIHWVSNAICLILCHPLSFCFQSFSALGSFPKSPLFASCGQSTGASVSASSWVDFL